MLAAPDLAEDQTAVTACAALWVVTITLILVKGISLAGWVQWIMTAIEMAIMAVLALMLSTIGTLQCNMLQFTRTMFALSRDGALHGRWSALHENWRTPYAATVLIGALGLLLLFASIGSQGIAAV